VPLPAKVIGHVGLWASVAACVACVVLLVIGATSAKESAGATLLGGLLFAPVAALGIWGFRDFLQLGDWAVASVVPLGLKLLGQLGCVLGSVAAAASLALAVMTIAFPGKVPPAPMKKVSDAWERVEPKDSSANAPRPGLAGTWVLAFFAALLARTLAASVAEARRWVRLGSLVVLGAAVVLFTVLLILNVTSWRYGVATLPLAFFDGAAVLVFLFLLVYFNLPETKAAFEAQRL